MNPDKKKRKKNDDHQQFEFCEVCRLSHNQGRRHKFFPTHKNSLSTLLTRFQSKLSGVKSFLKSPTRASPEHTHQSLLWCVFCNCDILDLDTQFAWSVISGNEIEHFASEEHWKRVKNFFWRHGGGMDRVDSFRIAEIDYAKWEKKCKSLKIEDTKAESIGLANNIHNEHNAESVDSFCNFNVDNHKFCISNGVVPLHRFTNEKTTVSSSVLSSVPEAGSPSHNISWVRQIRDAQYLKNTTGRLDNQHFTKTVASECSLHGSLKYGSQVCTGGRIANGEISQGLSNSMQMSIVGTEGNVHTGAPPPWFDDTKGDEVDHTQKADVCSKVRKSKLNPKRVGAAWAERRRVELEMERRGEVVGNNYDVNWLPNFGRVWQSGTRKDSRKEFGMENKSTARVDEGGVSEIPEGEMPLQPYISKRMRQDTSES